jgi:hypothetical protein
MPILGILASTLAFTPASIAGLKLWLDADDASTITLNGSNVSQWNDKSTNAFNFAQATAANQPARTLSGQNGRTVLTFDVDALTNASIDWGSSASTLFFVGKEDDVAGNSWQNFFTTGTGATGQWGYGIETNATSPNNNRISVFDIGQAHFPFASKFTNSNADVLCFTTQGISGGSLTANLFKNGTADGSNPVSVFTTTSAAGARIGSAASMIEPYYGTICEIIMYDSVLSTTDRNKVEDYLKTKWATV